MVSRISKWYRKILVCIALTGAAYIPPGFAHDNLTFTSWTGPYMRSQMLGFVLPYEQQTGERVDVDFYAGGLDEIRDQVESANVKWDVVDLTQADSIRACDQGLLEEIDHSILPPGVDGTPYQEDFVEGALNPCGVGNIVWATIFAYNPDRFPDEKPTTIADFFDLKSFPGRRAIRKDPSVIMEWALLAQGVPVEEIYPALETGAGLEQAFKKLDQLKGHIVWWENGRQPIRLLNNDEVAMSSIWATTGIEGSKEQDSNYVTAWDGRVIEMDLFGIVKGSRHPDKALEFIEFATTSQSLARTASYLPNGPARQSSLELIPEDLRKNLPNGSLHGGETSIMSDASWWATNYEAIAERFDAWVDEPVIKGAAGTVR